MVITDNDIKKLNTIFATKIDLTNLREEISDDMDVKLTQFRSDMYDKLDEILKEILASREEETILSHRVSDHDDRITKLEQAALQ